MSQGSSLKSESISGSSTADELLIGPFALFDLPEPKPFDLKLLKVRRDVAIGLASLFGLFGLWGLHLFGGLSSEWALLLSVIWLGSSFVVAVRTQVLHIPRTKEVLLLASPVVLGMLTQNVVNVVDNLFVGRLDASVALPGLAAIGISLLVLWLVGGFLSSIAVGTQIIAARRFGAGEPKAAGAAFMSALVFGTSLGLIWSVIGYVVLPDALPFLNDNPDVVTQGVLFSRIRFVGICFMVITAVCKGFFDAMGKTRVHMWAALIMNVINLVLCYGLILGGLGMPKLEVAGAAWASTLSAAVGTMFMLLAAFRPSVIREHGLFERHAISMSLMGRIAKLSFPTGTANIIAMGGFLLFHKAVAMVDVMDPRPEPIHASATAVIQQILMVMALSSFAFGSATATLVSRSLGAKSPNAAWGYSIESVKIGTLVSALISTLLFLYPHAALALFMDSGSMEGEAKLAAIEAGIFPLRIVAAASLFLTAGLVFTQSLYGSGNTLFVMIVEGILHVTCLVPLAWALGVYLNGGLPGIWSALAIYVLLLTTIMGAKFASGDWKNQEV